MTELMVAGEGGSEILLPVVQEGIEWSTERRSVPGKLTFQVKKDPLHPLEEGAAVQLRVDGRKVFFGFIFTLKTDREDMIAVTAYDQLRYLKNKDTYVYENMTASRLIQMIADDFQLNTGEIRDTGFVIGSGVEDNTTLFDMIEKALDQTLTNSGEMFVLYDDFGSLTLKNISDMYVRNNRDEYLVISAASGENFEYTSSIDSRTYNRIKLVYENEDGKRDVYITQHGENCSRWGVLQYFDTLSGEENGQAKTDTLLSLYNRKTKNLRIQNVMGDVCVRAGSLVAVDLDLGDMRVQSFMLVEQAKHVFKLNEHFMDLTLRGGDFVV